MNQLKDYFKASIESRMVPFLKKFGFLYTLSVHDLSDIHDVFTFKKDSTYIFIAHMGFNPKDIPWSFSPLLGKDGFKQTSGVFDLVPLWYIKQKIAPFEAYQKEAIKMNFEPYNINSMEEINQSITRAIFDLDTFCKDFLTNNFIRFDRIREIKYLEYLVQTHLVTETNWLGIKKEVMKQNEEVE